MKNLFRSFASGVAILTLVLLAGLLIYGCVSYDMGKYKRKYPGTTTLDYWLDGGKK